MRKVSRVQRSRVGVASCRGSKVGGVSKERDSGTEYSECRFVGKAPGGRISQSGEGCVVRETGDSAEKTERERNLLATRSQSPGLSLSVT